MEKRFQRHKRFGAACKAGIDALGLDQVPTDSRYAAATLTAPYHPRAVAGPDFLRKVKAVGAILAGELHPGIKDQYFRIGHMGAKTPGDLLAKIVAIETGLQGCGYKFELGAEVSVAQRVLQS